MTRSVIRTWFTPAGDDRHELATAAMLLVLGNFVLVVWHTFLLAHFDPDWTAERILEFALSVSVIPLIAALLLRARLVRLGGLTLLLIFSVAFVIGVMEHFVTPGPANALEKVPGPWTVPFQVSVALLVLLHVFACWLGFRAMRKRGLRS